MAGPQYASLCAAANERLAACVALLRQGPGRDRAAFEFATRDPDILDLVAVLSDPELVDWEYYAKNNRLPVPEPVNERARLKLNSLYERSDF